MWMSRSESRKSEKVVRRLQKVKIGTGDRAYKGLFISN